MKRLLMTAGLTLILLTGCAADAGVKFTKHFWDFRDKYVWENPALSDLQKESSVYAAGAVLKIDDKDIDADIAKHKEKKEGE